MSNADKPAYPDPMRGGDQAFYNQAPDELDSGLTKRERFAMAAMQGMLSNEAIHKDMNDIFAKGNDPVRDIAESSIVFADALLKQLEETE